MYPSRRVSPTRPTVMASSVDTVRRPPRRRFRAAIRIVFRKWFIAFLLYLAQAFRRGQPHRPQPRQERGERPDNGCRNEIQPHGLPAHEDLDCKTLAVPDKGKPAGLVDKKGST